VSLEAPIPVDPSFRLELPAFEGPLDLLLHLIQKHELNILDLPVAFVTERYLEFLSLMKELNLDVAAEYLLMAATLAHIKSRELLPVPPADQEDLEEEADPRSELIARLLEYQKYKQAAEQLEARGVRGRDVFGRGMSEPEAQNAPPLAEIGIFALLDAFHKVLARAKAELAFEITAEKVTIAEKIMQIVGRLAGAPGSNRECTFEELFEGAMTTYEIVVTFLALLEMAKRRIARIYQADRASPIHVTLLVTEVGPDIALDLEAREGQTSTEPSGGEEGSPS